MNLARVTIESVHGVGPSIKTTGDMKVDHGARDNLFIVYH